MGTTDCGGREERILVSVRLRPLNEKEIARNDVFDWECANQNTIIFKNGNLPMPERSMYPTAYTFDRVFRTDCSTKQVYEEGAKEVALSVVSGINSTVFAYGQTSSGKTYTMTGITEYTVADIYEHIEKHSERQYHLKFFAMEIYNESVRDLLSTDSTPLRLLDDPQRGTVVEKLTEEPLRDWDHVMELLSICEAQRQIGETNLNETSSRSHQIIRLTIESSAREFLSKDNSSTLAASVEFCVKNKDRVEVVSMVAVFRLIVSLCQIFLLERERVSNQSSGLQKLKNLRSMPRRLRPCPRVPPMKASLLYGLYKQANVGPVKANPFH